MDGLRIVTKRSGLHHLSDGHKSDIHVSIGEKANPGNTKLATLTVAARNIDLAGGTLTVAEKIGNVFRTFVSLPIIVALSACGSVPSVLDSQMLQHYQSTKNYGRLAVSVEDPASASDEILKFAHEVESYGRERGVPITDVANLTSSDSHIVLSLNQQGHFKAVLIRDMVTIDEIFVPPGFSSSIEEMLLNGISSQGNSYGEANPNAISPSQIIDEMLLLWHPPDLGREPRSPVPEYALKPGSAIRKSLPNVARSSNADSLPVNLGWQAWRQLESRAPTFRWEAFPRDWDHTPGVISDTFENVRYEFRLIPMFSSTGTVAINDLTEPEYSLGDNLEYCQLYKWTVRAVFQLNGSLRQTEWSGAFNIFPMGFVSPWISRRQSIGYNNSNGGYYFAVASPKNPFAEACVYR